MGRFRIDPDMTRPPVRIPGRVLNELCAHALQTQPEECCGLIMGDATERFRCIVRCRNDMSLHHRKDPERYPRDGSKAFYMNESDYLSAQTDAEQRGEQPHAIYHSHVGAGAYFSEMDQEYAEHELFPFPEAAHIVMAVWGGKVTQLGIFERDPETSLFTGRGLEAAAL
jgi:proteasome lid subunit RPN8/RPN11